MDSDRPLLKGITCTDPQKTIENHYRMDVDIYFPNLPKKEMQCRWWKHKDSNRWTATIIDDDMGDTRENMPKLRYKRDIGSCVDITYRNEKDARTAILTVLDLKAERMMQVSEERGRDKS